MGFHLISAPIELYYRSDKRPLKKGYFTSIGKHTPLATAVKACPHDAMVGSTYQDARKFLGKDPQQPSWSYYYYNNYLGIGKRDFFIFQFFYCISAVIWRMVNLLQITLSVIKMFAFQGKVLCTSLPLRVRFGSGLTSSQCRW